MSILPSYTIVDAHVHIHPHFDLNRLFLIALQNFRGVLCSRQIYESFTSFLLLAESAGVHRFTELKGFVGNKETNHSFIVEETEEPYSLRIITEGGQRLFVVSGRQIVTAEKLEVLALGFDGDYADGNPLRQVVCDLMATDCLWLLPWGAGKWSGSRGRLLKDFIELWGDEPLFLGDNGNRPKFWHKPAAFFSATGKSIYDLPGSDPLPFAEQEKKAGSSGFIAPFTIDEQRPFASLATQIKNQVRDVEPYVGLASSQDFIKHQLAMQLKKRL